MSPLTSANAKPITLNQLLTKEDQQRCFSPVPLDRELLIKRVKDGGHSGLFLANAFVSSYRTKTQFKHSLGEIIKLDYEAISLFQQILFVRHIPGWSDTFLYQIEQEIIAINGSE